MDREAKQLILDVSIEQDRLLKELVETYTKTVGFLVQKGELTDTKDIVSHLGRCVLKQRAESDAWLILNRPESTVKLPSLRMNGNVYRITKDNKLVFKAFIFQGIVEFVFRINIQGDRLAKGDQGVLTLFKGEQTWIAHVQPRRIPSNVKPKRERLSYPYILW